MLPFCRFVRFSGLALLVLFGRACPLLPPIYFTLNTFDCTDRVALLFFASLNHALITAVLIIPLRPVSFCSSTRMRVRVFFDLCLQFFLTFG